MLISANRVLPLLPVDKSGFNLSASAAGYSVTVLVIISTRTQLERSGKPPPVCFNYVEIAATLPAPPHAPAASTFIANCKPLMIKKQMILYQNHIVPHSFWLNADD